MNKLIAIVVASLFALSGSAALAADPPKDTGGKSMTKAALEKPANVTTEAWGKMTDTEKAKAVEAAKKDTAMKPAKKEKKGGC